MRIISYASEFHPLIPTTNFLKIEAKWGSQLTRVSFVWVPLNLYSDILMKSFPSPITMYSDGIHYESPWLEKSIYCLSLSGLKFVFPLPYPVPDLTLLSYTGFLSCPLNFSHILHSSPWLGCLPLASALGLFYLFLMVAHPQQAIWLVTSTCLLKVSTLWMGNHLGPSIPGRN